MAPLRERLFGRGQDGIGLGPGFYQLARFQVLSDILEGFSDHPLHFLVGQPVRGFDGNRLGLSCTHILGGHVQNTIGID